MLGVPYRLATQVSVLATMVVDGGETLVVACVQSLVQPPAQCVTTLTELLLVNPSSSTVSNTNFSCTFTVAWKIDVTFEVQI